MPRKTVKNAKTAKASKPSAKSLESGQLQGRMAAAKASEKISPNKVAARAGKTVKRGVSAKAGKQRREGNMAAKPSAPAKLSSPKASKASAVNGRAAKPGVAGAKSSRSKVSAKAGKNPKPRASAKADKQPATAKAAAKPPTKHSISSKNAKTRRTVEEKAKTTGSPKSNQAFKPPKGMVIRRADRLTNALLVSTPAVSDKEFRHTVIYVCHHDKDGAMGFVLNRPSRVHYSYVVQQLDLNKSDFDPQVLKRPMLIGGPIQRNRGFILHLNGGQELVLVKPNNKISLKELLTRNPERSEFFFGHTGWSAGQLEEELLENSWQVSNIGLDELLAAPINKRHDLVWERLGAKFTSYSNFVGHA